MPPLAHGYPLDFVFAVAHHLLTNSEFLGIVDYGFDPKNNTGLVVHLEPVLFHSMFDPGSRNAFEREIANIADDFPFKVGADFSSKKAQ